MIASSTREGSSQSALVCSSFRIVSFAFVSAAYLSSAVHLYSPVLSARGIPWKLTIDPRESPALIWLAPSRP